MAIDPVSAGIPEDLYYSTSQRKTSNQLDKDAFLQLFLLSLKNQDPTNTQDPSQFMSQMAQFTILEQLANMSMEVSRMKLAAEMDQATGLIGRMVKANLAVGVEIEGIVEKITAYQGEVKVFLEGNPTGLTLDKVTEVY